MPLPGSQQFFYRCALAICVVVLASLVTGCRDSRQKPLAIGLMICNSREETLQRFLPLVRYLSEKTGVEFTAVPVDTHEFVQRFKTGEFALTHTNSLLYVIMKEQGNLSLVAGEKRGSFGSRTGGALIARKESGLRALADIRGKRLAFGPMLAPTGYLAEYDLLVRSGIDPEQDLGSYTIPSGTFKHEKLIYGVLFGQYDVAAAPLLDLEIMTREGKISADDFVILARTDLIPYCTVGASPSLAPATVAKVRAALLELTPAGTVAIDGERLKVLKAAWVDGYEELRDSDYDPIREMARRLNMPPYQIY